VLQLSPRARAAVPALGLTVTAIAAISFTGFLFGASVLYSLPWLTTIALQTSTILLSVGLGLVAAVPERQPMRGVVERSAAGELVRRALPVIVILPLVLGVIRTAGEEAGLYDAPVGRSLLILSLISCLCVLLWRSAAAVRRHESEHALELSERQRAESALARSEGRYRTLVSVITDFPLVADAAGGFSIPQPAWHEYTGQPFEQARGGGWIEAFHPDDRGEIARLWQRACETGETYRATGRLWHAPSRAYRYVASRATPVRNADGTVREWIGALTDVHETRMADLALAELAQERGELLALAEEAREHAESASRAKDEFLAMLSHELRSPLNTMLSWLPILARAPADAPLFERAIGTMERSVASQARVIDDLLEVSRATSGKIELERSRLSLGALVAATVESMRPAARLKRQILEVSVPEAGVEIEGDAIRLQQVVGNLVHNAIKFTPEGGRIDVRVRRAADRAEIEVEDTGVGIDAALLERVFERFVQSETGTTRRHGGLGLGLAIVKQLTGLHGGTASAESAGLGKGSRFTVRLPLPAPGADERAESRKAKRAELEALDVLLVEDDSDTREALALLLAARGARVRSAGSVREAVAAFLAREPDVIVSDISMPDEDGFALIRAIREHERGSGRRTHAIAVTGFASRADRDAALRSGFDDHLGKPLHPVELMERLGAVAARERVT
jgi:PAS domain S-box-containing protein